MANDAARYAAEVIMSSAMRQACGRLSASVSLHHYLSSLYDGDGGATGNAEMLHE